MKKVISKILVLAMSVGVFCGCSTNDEDKSISDNMTLIENSFDIELCDDVTELTQLSEYVAKVVVKEVGEPYLISMETGERIDYDEEKIQEKLHLIDAAVPYTLTVSEVYDGEISESEITLVKVGGGCVKDFQFTSNVFDEYTVGQELILFLNKDEAGLYHLAHVAQGAVRVEDESIDSEADMFKECDTPDKLREVVKEVR